MSSRLCSCGCGRLARKGGTLSSTCYMRAYRKTKSGKEASRKANREWRKRNPDKAKYYDQEYKRAWRRKTHFYVPQEVIELRDAVKRLEQALAAADEYQGASDSS